MTNTQNLILRHWKTMANKHQGLPSRRDFRMQDLGRLVTDIIIVEIKENPPDFTYRLIGSSVEENFAANYTDKSLSDIPGKGPESRIWSNLKIAKEQKKPLFKNIPCIGPNIKQDTLNVLFLPLAADHKTPDRLLIVPNFPRKKTKGIFQQVTPPQRDRLVVH